MSTNVFVSNANSFIKLNSNVETGILNAVGRNIFQDDNQKTIWSYNPYDSRPRVRTIETRLKLFYFISFFIIFFQKLNKMKTKLKENKKAEKFWFNNQTNVSEDETSSDDFNASNYFHVRYLVNIFYLFYHKEC